MFLKIHDIMIRVTIKCISVLLIFFPLQLSAKGTTCNTWEARPKVDGQITSFKCEAGLHTATDDEGFSECSAVVQLDVKTLCQPTNHTVKARCFLKADSFVREDPINRVRNPHKELSIGYSEVRVHDKSGSGIMHIRFPLMSSFHGKVYKVKPTDFYCDENN